jgi:hypothetical protein
MSFEAASPQTPTISFISSRGKTVFGLRIFYSRAHFQDRNWGENREVPVLTGRLLVLLFNPDESARYTEISVHFYETTQWHIPQDAGWLICKTGYNLRVVPYR